MYLEYLYTLLKILIVFHDSRDLSLFSAPINSCHLFNYYFRHILTHFSVFSLLVDTIHCTFISKWYKITAEKDKIDQYKFWKVISNGKGTEKDEAKRIKVSWIIRFQLYKK